jgi:hypothetical protein
MLRLPFSTRTQVSELLRIINTAILYVFSSIRQVLSVRHMPPTICSSSSGYHTQHDYSDPHIGHLYSEVIADICGRYARQLLRRETLLVTGTDDHGLKIQQAAKELGEDPIEFTKRLAQRFKVRHLIGIFSRKRYTCS